MVSEPVLVTLDQKCSLGYIVTVFQPVLSSLPPALFSLVGVVSAVADLPSGFLLSSPSLVWFRPWLTVGPSQWFGSGTPGPQPETGLETSFPSRLSESPLLLLPQSRWCYLDVRVFGLKFRLSIMIFRL